MLADSSAINDIKKILPQHQSALTLLNNRLQNPKLESLSWLDLACGKGQIIAQLQHNLSTRQREKLSYWGFDIDVHHTKVAEKLASGLGLKRQEFVHGDMATFGNLFPEGLKFDFITCTNTAHELQPGAFANLIISSIKRLSEKGELFIYDMESLSEPELGALPWKLGEIKILLDAIFRVLDCEYQVEPSGWVHTTCNGWSVTIQREFIERDEEYILSKESGISEQVEAEINRILLARERQCHQMLDSFCKFGTTTADDEASKVSGLYEFWALHRIMGMRK